MDYLIYPNGIDGVTGDYLTHPALPLKISDLVEKNPDRLLSVHRHLLHETSRTRPPKMLGLPLGIDPLNIQRAGWGIVFPADARADIRESLNPLIEHRRHSIPPDRCKILEYREGEGLREWLRRYNVSPGSVTPTKVPFYLLLIGSPDEIPFEFQYLLSIEYAVGRLSFDRADQYARYATSISSYEKCSMSNRREVFFWSPRHDKATELSTDFLVNPLTRLEENHEEGGPAAESLAYENHCFIGEQATKQRLGEILNSVDAIPAMLFTASHGLGWPKGHEMQKEKQGALVCQDWKDRGKFDESCYFAASDVTDEAKVSGLVVFSFACYSAGTPAFDTFNPSSNWTRAASEAATKTAEDSFVAALPQKILSHPRGSALAFIGHVDRAWGFSIKPPNVDAQLVPFRNCIARILKGEPVGLATRDFTQRYAVLSTALLDSFNMSEKDELLANRELMWAWIERNDAQSYVVLGDPAARVSSQ